MSEMWTAKLRNKWQKNLPIEKLLPDDQPSYVASWIYVFGVLTLSALAMIIASGIILAFEGPAWYHTSGSLSRTSVVVVIFILVSNPAI